jgi:hypothetical protein
MLVPDHNAVAGSGLQEDAGSDLGMEHGEEF